MRPLGARPAEAKPLAKVGCEAGVGEASGDKAGLIPVYQNVSIVALSSTSWQACWWADLVGRSGGQNRQAKLVGRAGAGGPGTAGTCAVGTCAVGTGAVGTGAVGTGAIGQYCWAVSLGSAVGQCHYISILMIFIAVTFFCIVFHC